MFTVSICRKVVNKLKFPTRTRFSLFSKLRNQHEDNINDSEISDVLNFDKEYQLFSENHLNLTNGHNCYIIHPYVKWGPNKLHDITPLEQLEEAKSLIKTLPYWSVEETIKIPLLSLNKKTLFGSGSLERLKLLIQQNSNISAIFINMGSLQRIQIKTLEQEFGLPILDRYKVIMQILKVHATSKHAKLQVAMAELNYLQKYALVGSQIVTSNPEKFKLTFQERKQKLKNAINELRQERSLLRNKRQKNKFPIVAVVGYTNSGKTSLIKALTGEEKLKPRNQLFATLDVTLHPGLLPSGLEVLYVDTVGFISDIPTNLIECFVATLEDAVLADVILHVEDISSSSNYEFKRKHVLKTLENLEIKTNTKGLFNKLISVGNKCDLVLTNNETFDVMKVSAKTDFGLDALRFQLETKILETTDRKKLIIRLPAGGDEISWLYKNSTVISEVPDNEISHFINVDVIIAHNKLEQFKHYFLKN